MKRTTTFAALAMCASLYLTPGPAQAGLNLNGLNLNGLNLNGLNLNGLSLNGLTQNGLTQNGLTQNGSINGLALQPTRDDQEPSRVVPNDRLPFNGLSQQGIGKRQL